MERIDFLVKGISRQVVVVRSPDRKLFDEAIFLLRPAAGAEEVTDDALLKEAERSAGHLLRAQTPSRRRELLLGIGCALLGAALACAVWCAVLFL